MTNESCCCMADILKNIVILQNNCENIENTLNSCASPILGNASNCLNYNTRPITLYNCSGDVLEFPYTLTNGTTITGTSAILRIERVNDCCASFRVLAVNPDATSTLPYVATNSFITVNLDCVCILTCLPDTLIACS